MTDKLDLDGMRAKLDDGWSEMGDYRQLVEGQGAGCKVDDLFDAIDLRDAVISELTTAYREMEREMRARFTAPIVCMCGSTRFKQAWISENARLTGEGNIVLAVGLWGHHERVFPDDETKAMLDNLHKRKIDLCDWVWVLDVDGYIGDSTRSEIEYAEQIGRPVRYLSREFSDYVEPVDPLEREVRAVNRAIESAEFDIADDHDPYSSGMRRVVELVREAMGWPREDR